MTATVQDAQADLMGLLRKLPPGETLTLTDGDTPVANLMPLPPPALRPPPGLWKGKVVILSEEDDYPNGFPEGKP